MEGGRFLLILVFVILLYEPGVSLVWQLAGWCLPSLPRQQEVQQKKEEPPQQGQEGEGGKEAIQTITGHCLPKLVCQLFSLENTEKITDSERNLIALIGYATIVV